MSDLAPFVAAVLRDKTVIDQQEEIVKLQNERAKLRNQLAQLRSVEFTGPEGEPVYARGRVDEGHDLIELDSDTWVLILEQVQPCLLSELGSVEVHLGGACKGSFQDVFDGRFDSHPEDGENQKVVNFGIGGSFLCGVECKVHGWPEDSWRSAMDNGDLRAAIDNGDAEEFLLFLVENVASEQPRGKVVEFTNVFFAKGSIPPGLLQF